MVTMFKYTSFNQVDQIDETGVPRTHDNKRPNMSRKERSQYYKMVIIKVNINMISTFIKVKIH